jgi:acyl-[acyl-carrier-protein]-phospholipid O-acyltransferase/long-chain-fatty-acid--[acyl-carrier-protein] ligase
MKKVLRWLVRLLFRFEAYNEAALNTPGPVLLLPNHASWWDWVFIGACLEDDWRFVTSSTTAELSWLHKRIMVNRRTFPVDINSPYAVKHMAEYLQKGGRLVLFPEGRISTTGSLMKLFEGTGFLIYKTRPKVITAYIRGASRLFLSRNPNGKEFCPKITVDFSDVLAPPQLEPVSATVARARLSEWLRHQMLQQRFDCEMALGAKTVPHAILHAARRNPRRVMLQDVTLKALTYRNLEVGANALAARWRARLSQAEQRVGVLLPNVNAMPAVLLSLWLANRIPAILNYTSGSAILLSCARLAGLKQIITSQAFLERANLDVEPLQAAGIELVYVEDVRAEISLGQKLGAILRVTFRGGASEATSLPEETAIVLFTSGSEGDPKGVELTHRNLLANIRQMLSVVDLMDTDRFFNALPLFHSFGLTVGLLLPLVQGAFVFLYLSPLHYRVIPAAFYNLNCTVFFGTNTFLNGYARKAHPYDFYTLRYLFAGAEKLQEGTSALWMRKFGVRVLEGYGATECSPCVSVNIPMHPCPGSAGQFLPGIDYRLEPVEGIGDRKPEADPGSQALAKNRHPESSQTPGQPELSAGSAHSGRDTRHASVDSVGRLFVRGPNIMKGYLNAEANAKFKQLGGWYDTGDIAKIDTDGFLHLLGRLKRFAKVSGEMVSLTAVEDCLAGAFPQYGPKFGIAVISKSDEAKGEKLIAVTNEPRLRLEEIREVIRSHGLGNLAVPREIKAMRELPLLGTGKINHRELERQAAKD